MPATLAMPQNWEQDTVALLPDLIWDEITDSGGDELLAAMPFSYTDASKVKWDQYQNPYGLIPLRGLNAAPDIVKMPGLKTYEADPGFYGLETMLEESEIINGRQPNTVNDPLDVADRLGQLTLNGATMIVSRIRQILASLLSTGLINNVSTSGEIAHRYKVDNYQTFSPANDGSTGPGWAADPELATPISDLIYWQTNKLNKGTSADFGPKSQILCNPQTVNDFWNTKQVRESFRSKYGATFLRGEMPNLDGENSINGLLMGMGLPKLVPYAKGYYSTLAAAITEDPDEFTYAIGAKTLIWLGVRPKGQQLGTLKLTRHAGVNAYGAGGYPSVSTQNQDKADLAKGVFILADYEKMMPQSYRIQMGMNACPVLYYFRQTAGITYT